MSDDSEPPPFWGPGPQEARDLDAVLCGDLDAVYGSLRPVAAAVAALRAGPAPAELDGEAAALAAFRTFRLPDVPAGPAATVPFPVAVGLLDPPAGRPGARAGSPSALTAVTGLSWHRRPSRTPRPSWTAATLLGGAAAAVVAVVLVFALSGGTASPGSQSGHRAQDTHAAASASAGQLEGGGSASPTPVRPATAKVATPASSAGTAGCHPHHSFHHGCAAGPGQWSWTVPERPGAPQGAGGLPHWFGPGGGGPAGPGFGR